MADDDSSLTAKQRQRRAYYHANKERHVAAVREWRLANPEKYKAQCARQYAKNRYSDIARLTAWKAANPDKNRESGVKYREKYRARVQAHVRRYQALKQRAMPCWVTMEDLLPFYEAARRLSAGGVAHEVDHIVPLTSKLVCGLHCPANLQVIPMTDNRRKHNRYWPDMP
jgi:hypothetical protein